MNIYLYIRDGEIVTSSTNKMEGLLYDYEFQVVWKWYYEYEKPKKWKKGKWKVKKIMKLRDVTDKSFYAFC